jgi:hypothetical protein
LGHDGETSNHKEEEKEKDKELFENNDQHSYQEADFSPDSYQKTKLDEAEDHNEQLQTLQSILIVCFSKCDREIYCIHDYQQQIIHIPETQNVSFYALLDICDLVNSKWKDYRDRYNSWDDLILIFA